MQSMQKETYERAEMEVVQIDPEETILTSSGPQPCAYVYSCPSYEI